MLTQAIAKIEAQQNGLANTQAYGVGEQLKDILRAEPWNAPLVARDLDLPEMSIRECEKKIAAAAKKNGGWCSGKQADEIIRKFYGLTTAPSTAPAEPEPKPEQKPRKRAAIRLEDFF